MDISTSSLVANLVIGTVGFSVFLYGKKQQRLPQLVAGLVLMLYPFFVEDAVLVWAIGAAILAGLWYAVRKGL